MENMKYARITSENIRILLKRSHVSIRRLSELLDISPSTLTDSLKSKKGVPIDQLMKIAEYFDTNISALCDPNLFADRNGDRVDVSIFATKYSKLCDESKNLVRLIIEYELQRSDNKI